MNTSNALLKVVDKMVEREKIGVFKYGCTVDRKDLTQREWLIHLQEELMDSILYIEAQLGEDDK